MPAPKAVQAATIQRFIDAWKVWKPEVFLSTWSGDCVQQGLPFSLGMSARSRQESDHLIPALMGSLRNFQLKVHNVVHDAETSRAVIYAITSAESPFGPYANEHAMFLWIDETGHKVSRIEEMFDSAFMNTFLPRLKEHFDGQDKDLAQHIVQQPNVRQDLIKARL